MARRKPKKTCSKCGMPLENNRWNKYRYCRKCHAEYMRLTRPKYSELSEEQKMKGKCRSIARMALKRGRIEQKPCEVCCAFDSQMHHDDYAKPLEVRWLCRRHHLEHHKKCPVILIT